MTAPNFCMVLRKHIANGRIVKIYQPHMERIIHFDIEHLDEMGDLCQKTLIVELMGKHSNIIFCNSDGKIIDSIKHIPSMMSSLREVLPGRNYCIPATLKKADSVDKISADETGKVNIYENATTTKNEDGSITVTGDLVGIKQDGHSYELTATVEPTCTTPGKRVYTCTTHEDETYEEIISDALGHHFVNGVCTRCGAPESNGSSSAVTLTVTGAGAYETSIADGRYVVAVPAEAAVLSGCLGNLKELKAQGVNTLVFRTQLRETALNIDSMLSLGVDDTLFTLTHSGESAELTVGGFAHNELLH